MSTYWNAYPDFSHDGTAPLRQEFNRLAAYCGWRVGRAKYKREWEQCALKEFSYQFGHDDSRLAGWQAMCAFVRVKNVPDSIKKCKEVLRTKVWVNIYDLIDAKKTGQPVKKHSSANALREYSKESDKIFPKKIAKQNRFLAALLIEMF
ncbi:hypothetical protein B0H11DRAFT_2202355 [Mycena galericulata]|nr:hypothetical protein B0H11DRAFT_2202355 [Mycena galericulata]